jgi:hypothetical protein
MADIVLKKLSGNCGDTVPVCTTVTIRNFQSLDFDLNTPISTMPLPECNDQGAILVKGEGNTLAISVSWTLHDETSSISSNASITTVNEQIYYWINNIQPDSIEDSWEITIPGDTTPWDIVRTGSIRKMSFNKSATAPTLYEGRVEFQSGDVVAGES